MDNFKINKKEIYFSNDVYSRVATNLNIPQRKVESVFNSFLNFYKRFIQETDGILYDLPHLGELSLTENEALTELEKFKKRHQREKNKEEKLRLEKVIQNYRIKIKKIRVEVEKFKNKKAYINPNKYNNIFLSRGVNLIKSQSIKNKRLRMGLSLDEVMKKQNEYAYKFYEKNNIPVTS